MSNLIYKNTEENENTCIIFVHGFMTKSKETWTGKAAECWTSVLGKQQKCTVVHFEYPNQPIRGSGTLPLKDAADYLAQAISEITKRYPNIVVVTHSFGGLVFKKMVVDVLSGDSERLKDGLKAVASFIMISCPNRGHTFATIAMSVLLLFSIAGFIPSRNLISMRRWSPDLLELHEKFMMHLNARREKIRIVTVGEEKNVALLFRVNPKDSKLEIHGAQHSVLPKNHFNICKELSMDDPLLKIINPAITTAKFKKSQRSFTGSSQPSIHQF